MKRILPIAALALAPIAASAQSSCYTAQLVSEGIYTTGVVNGTAPATPCIGANVATNGLWYRFTSAVDTTILVSTHVDGYTDRDTRVHVYTGICNSLVCYAGDDDSGPGNTSQVSFPVTAGAYYTIAFDNQWNSEAFTFQISALYVPPPPEGIVNFISTGLPGGNAMGIVDMNDDGLDDAVYPGSSSFNISYQLPGGGFNQVNFPTTPAQNTASWSFAIGDWDSNGFRDLLYGGGQGATFMNADATGANYSQVTFPQYIFCQRTNFVDVNNDGLLDAFSCHDVDANVAFINDGNGNLVFTQGGYGTTCGNYGSIWTDIDNDGSMDLFVAKCGCDPTDLLMLNDGSGVFNNVAPSLGLNDSHQSWSSAWGDFDNDGDMDVLIGASSSGYHKLMRNEGDGTFTNVTPNSGMDTFNGQSIEWTAHDFNNDGYVDIMGGGAIHYNNGNMTFSHDPTAPGNSAIGDLNNDGFLDVIGGGGYMRNSGNNNNWIKIKPVGVTSNRDAIGARVYVTSALGTQIREVRSGDGFRYMSYIGAYFGLGQDAEVTEVRVVWPNGNEDIIEGPAINGSIEVVEGVSTGVAALNTSDFGVYPNPAVDQITVTGAALNAQLEVFDATGKLVLADRMQGGRLSVASLIPGVYQVRVIEAGEVRQLRFNKQ
ncbi:MAG: VCBS repeat-containing protein [Flavobacteriales bacterium]|nr:VCBS repeat-containing protein [Flavobacteriales bacterium]MBP6643662.1 VCBS repeat-containing protein [Flavobacteriales bacterium]MBP7155447.1 VCBS repeat-containing protein [Flavobacteriales bacterium]HQV75052.1 FG-GAP-like repeat-containing protein [Flavobacteriales bacterium]